MLTTSISLTRTFRWY